jgi:hypothetical protein
MNSTVSQTTITMTTTTAKRANEIRRVTIYDYRGKAKKIENLRGVQI